MRNIPQTITISSADIEADAMIPSRHVFDGSGCTGANVSPALEWSEGPEGTHSYAVTVYDPDAPTGSGWWHWIVYDIPASVRSIETGAGIARGKGLPKGAKQGRTDYGTHAWGGPCPPPGDQAHRYVFTVFALGVTHLDVPDDATAAAIGFDLHANALAKGSFTATFGR